MRRSRSMGEGLVGSPRRCSGGYGEDGVKDLPQRRGGAKESLQQNLWIFFLSDLGQVTGQVFRFETGSMLGCGRRPDPDEGGISSRRFVRMV